MICAFPSRYPPKVSDTCLGISIARCNEVIELQKQMSRQKKTTIGVLIALGLILLSAAVILFFSRLERSREKAPEGAGLALSRTSTAETDEFLSENGILNDDELIGVNNVISVTITDSRISTRSG